MAESLSGYRSADSIIDVAKKRLGIEKQNTEMTGKEIGDVIKMIGFSAPDTIWATDKPVMGRIGIGLMLSLTLYEFPEFYTEHELWQRN